MIKLFLTPVLMFVSFCAFANKDSLEAIFKDNHLADTTRWKAAEKLITLSAKKDPEGTNAFIKMWEKQVAEQKNTFWNAKIFVMKGFVEMVKRTDLKAGAALYTKAAEIFMTGNYIQDAAKAYKKVGDCYFLAGDYNNSMESYRSSIQLYKELKNEKEQVPLISMIGNIFFYLSNYPKAIENYHLALKISESLKDEDGLSMSYGNIANVYGAMADYHRSLDFQLKSLVIRERLHDTLGLIASLGNVGNIYGGLKDWKKALEYQQKRVKLIQIIKKPVALADTYGALGTIYANLKEFDTALDYLKKGIEISSQEKHGMSLTTNYLNMANVYFDMKKYSKALEYAVKSESNAKEFGYRNEEKDASLVRSKAAEGLGNTAEALNAFRHYIQLRDTIFSEEKGQEIARKEMQYEFDKKTATDSIRNLEEKKTTLAHIEAQNAQIKQEKTLRFGLYAGIILILVFSLFMYNRFMITRKQKSIIEHQKVIVEVKQKEIIDSITYARRIQRALMANEKYIEKSLNRLNNLSY
jgi:tetratricopeptide (TPR) repeat protein